VHVGAGDLGAEVGEALGGGPADAGAGADDQRAPPAEVEEVAVVSDGCGVVCHLLISVRSGPPDARAAAPLVPLAPTVVFTSSSTASTRRAITSRLERQNAGSSMSMPKPRASVAASAMPVEASSSS